MAIPNDPKIKELRFRLNCAKFDANTNLYKKYGLYGDFIKELYCPYPKQEVTYVNQNIRLYEYYLDDIKEKAMEIIIPLYDADSAPFTLNENYLNNIYENNKMIQEVVDELGEVESNLLTSCLASMPSEMDFSELSSHEIIDFLNTTTEPKQQLNLRNIIRTDNHSFNQLQIANFIHFPHKTRHIATWQNRDELDSNNKVEYHKDISTINHKKLAKFINYLNYWCKNFDNHNYDNLLLKGKFDYPFRKLQEGYVLMVHPNLGYKLKDAYRFYPPEFIPAFENIGKNSSNDIVGIDNDILILKNKHLPVIKINENLNIYRSVLLAKNAIATASYTLEEDPVGIIPCDYQGQMFIELNIGCKTIQIPEYIENYDVPGCKSKTECLVDCGRVCVDIAIDEQKYYERD